MTRKTAASVLTEIHAAAKASCPETRRLERHVIGQVAHQGDVYLHLVSAEHPRGKETGKRQVAIGDTQGSRHVAEGDGVCVFEGSALPSSFAPPAWLQGADPAAIFLGPVIVAANRFILSHPEHAHHDLPPGCYQVTYQADARARARVAD